MFKFKQFGAIGLIYFLSIAVGAYAILQSRGSTSGIGFLFLPFWSLIPALLVFLYQKSSQKIKIIPALLLLVFFIYQFYLINNIKEKNIARDEATRVSREKYERYKTEINISLTTNKGYETATLNKLLLKNPDRELILVILENDFCDPEVLHQYTQSDDLGFTYNVANNSSTRPDDLEYLFRKAKFQFYYYAPLSKNKNTPTQILRELYELREKNTAIGINLYNNPSTPKEIKDLLSQ